MDHPSNSYSRRHRGLSVIVLGFDESEAELQELKSERADSRPGVNGVRTGRVVPEGRNEE